MKKVIFLKRMLSLALAGTLFVSLAACGKSQDTVPVDAGQTDAGTYPIVDKPLTLTLWVDMRKASTTVQDFNEKACFKEMEKKTGIHIEFKHPPAGQVTDQFNLMVASNDYTDIIWKRPTEAIANQFIVPLNDYIDKYAPDYKKILDKYPNFKKSMYTDEGVLTGFGYVIPMLEQNIISGPMIRKDWLDKLGLKLPETIDDWEQVLTAFKERDPNGNGKADEIPYDSKKNTEIMLLSKAWGVKNDYYLEGEPQTGKVKYGPIEPAFKDFLVKMNDWYKKGLININYLTTDQKLLDANITGNKSGATYGGIGGYLGNYTGLMIKDKDFLLWPTVMPRLTANSKTYGEIARQWTQGAADVAYITTANKHVVETVRWLNWGYTEEGQMALNFGTEGQTYKMVDNKPVYTDEIMKNPKGLSITNALAKDTMVADEHATFQKPEVLEQTTCASPAQRQALRTWSVGLVDSASNTNLMLPPITLTADETSADNARMNDIKTYASEMLDKFITGKEPLENYDKFVSQLKKMGIDQSIKIRQDALERWRKRGGVEVTTKMESMKLNFKNSPLITEKGVDILDKDLK